MLLQQGGVRRFVDHRCVLGEGGDELLPGMVVLGEHLALEGFEGDRGEQFPIPATPRGSRVPVEGP